MQPSLEQKPNVILLAAGTNDMNSDSNTCVEGNDPEWASGRLWWMIKNITETLPDAVVLAAMIINTCDNLSEQRERTIEFRQWIADTILDFMLDGKAVLAVDFGTFTDDLLQDCVHPTNHGYDVMGDYWYDFLQQIPENWIEKPAGEDPVRNRDGIEANGGLDRDIPDPDWGTIPIFEKSASEVKTAADRAKTDATQRKCNGKPLWIDAGKIALGGVGHNGEWKYKKNWIQADHSNWQGKGKVADGIGKDPSYVR